MQYDKGSGAALAQQYRDQGLVLLPEKASFEEGGNGVEAGVSEMLDRMLSGRWKVFDHLEDWFAEFRLYHRKDGLIVKAHDDRLSASRYAMMMKRWAVMAPAARERVEQHFGSGSWMGRGDRASRVTAAEPEFETRGNRKGQFPRRKPGAHIRTEEGFMPTTRKESPEDEYRRLKGIPAGTPVPVSMESPTLQPDQARNLEMQRDRQARQLRRIGPALAGRPAASEPRPMSTVEAARAVLDKAALASDIATVGFAAGGITLPAAAAAKLLNTATEVGLAGVNSYDAFANGNWGPLKAQATSFPARYIPGGRLLQQGLKTVRGPTGILRDGAGRFRTSILNNEGIERAGQAITENYIEAIADKIFNRPR